MEFFKTPNFPFLKYRRAFFALSGFLAVISILSFMFKGPNFSIDFTGGTLVQGFFKNPVPLEDIRNALEKSEIKNADLQRVLTHNAVIIRFKSDNTDNEKKGTIVADALAKAFPDNPFELERSEFVGPVVGRHLVKQAFLAIIFSMLGIIVYVAFRFKNWIWGAAGVFALVHDVFLSAGFLSVMNREISITVIAALLTLAGYSINDTIVIFDRIREHLRSRRKEPLDIIIDKALNETLSRTIITSLTVFMVLIALLIWGGEVLRDFSMALTFGVAVGSYSTLFIATPLVYIWQTQKDSSKRR